MRKIFIIVLFVGLVTGCTKSTHEETVRNYLFYYNDIEEEFGSPYYNTNLSNVLKSLPFSNIKPYPIVATLGQNVFSSTDVIYSEYMDLIVDGKSVRKVELNSSLQNVTEFIQPPNILGYTNFDLIKKSIATNLKTSDTNLIDAYLSEDMIRYLGVSAQDIKNKSVKMELDVYVPVLNSSVSPGFSQLDEKFYVYPYDYIFKPVRIQFEIAGILYNSQFIGGPEMIISLDYQDIVKEYSIEEILPLRYIVECESEIDIPEGYHLEEIGF